ncbi:MAG: PTS sugar transporter subunit IIA [Chloroherpetonaceae bacterium]|nr:PTS sugar transporter subunit IIA [Chloroherpetonaceae bacterium]
MRLTDFITPEFISLGLDVRSKNDLLEKMLTLISSNQSVTDKTKLRFDVLKREKDAPTGIGNGVALPHAKTKAVTAPVVALSILSKPIDYGSSDNEPVKIVFLLAVPENLAILHLKFLSQIAKTVQQPEMRLRLSSAQSIEDILFILTEKEKVLPEF